jgi:hypothetical protein
VSDGYFAALGMSLLSGRDFNQRDTPESPAVAIISESLARQLWPDGGAVGQRIVRVAGDGSREEPPLLVVGVVGEALALLDPSAESAMVYKAVDQWHLPGPVPLTLLRLVAYGPQGARSVVQQTRLAIDGADPFARVMEARTLRAVIGDLLYPRRAATWIVGLAGLAGALLAGIGLYGVVSYAVSQQLGEFGIRSALGADRRRIRAHVVRHGVRLSAFAAVPGLALGYLTVRLTSRVVGEVPTNDWVAIVGVMAFVTIVVLTASYVPARRAARLEPMVVLRGL